jgi:hypothetical protein
MKDLSLDELVESLHYFADVDVESFLDVLRFELKGKIAVSYSCSIEVSRTEEEFLRKLKVEFEGAGSLLVKKPNNKVCK